MNLKEYIVLPIVFMTDAQAKLDDLGVDPKLSQSEIREMTFFNIEAISPYREDGKEMSMVLCNGDFFICKYSYEKLHRKLTEIPYGRPPYQ